MRNHNLYHQEDDKSCTHVIPYLYELTATTFFNKIEIENLNNSNRFNGIDLSMTATTKNNQEVYYLIEVKGRRIKSTQYDNLKDRHFPTNNGAMCDADKYDVLKKAAQEINYNPIFASSYTDGVVMLWNLNRLTDEDIVEENKLRGVTTVEDNGKHRKLCIEINKEKAAILLKNNPSKIFTWDEWINKKVYNFNQ